MYIIQNSVSLQRVSAAQDAEEQEMDDTSGRCRRRGRSSRRALQAAHLALGNPDHPAGQAGPRVPGQQALVIAPFAQVIPPLVHLQHN